MQYELKIFNRNVPDNELIDDLKRVAEKLGLNKISSRQYNDNGARYTAGTISTRFGTWNKALEKADLIWFSTATYLTRIYLKTSRMCG